MSKTVQISATFVGLEESIRKALGAGVSGGLKIPINDRAFNQSITGMTSNMRRFEQSLDFSNRRVIAFGTSASIVYGTVRAFNELVKATIEVEKTMVSINSIFGLSARNLDTFAKSLFNVARQTGQAFNVVADAAQEFSRQGLSVADTLKRTHDTMILVRLTGLDTAKAVSTLTAAINTFSRAGEDSESILNKIVAADQRFAVSARDITEAFQRVGSVVQDAGVSIDQFIGLVTAAKQITSRDGAVIGNSLKTILTRLERSTTLDDLRALGIAVDDAAGHTKPALQVFDALAKSYRGLGREQQQLVAQLGGGVFQINQFKALLLDLGKVNGVAAQATKVSATATNEALLRNAALNDTLATSLQNLKTNATEAASVIGSLALKPVLKEGIDLGNLVAGVFKNAKNTGDTKASEDFGAYLGESILKGIGNVLSGPGLVFIARVIAGVVNRARPELMTDIRSAASLIGAPGTRTSAIGMALAPAGEAEAIQRTNQLVSAGTKEEQARYMAAKSVAEQELAILAILERQAAVYAAQVGATTAMTPALTNLRKRRNITPMGASGYIPMAEEASAIARGVGGAPSHARPVYLPSFNRGGGQQGIVANTSEFVVPHMAGGGAAIYNRDMVRKYGLPPGSKPVAAGGFVPNAAGGSWLEHPNTPLTSYQAALQRITTAEQEMEATWSNLTQRFANKIVQSAATLNANASIAGLGGVLPYGPKATPQQIAQANVRVIRGQTNNATPAQMAAYEAERAASAGFGTDYTLAYKRNALKAQLNSPQEQALIAADLEKDRLIYQTKQDSKILERRQRFAGRASALQNALLVGSFGSAFLPQGTSGQASGMASGAAGGALNAGAFGAFAGSIFGPMGTAIGAGVGILGGGVKGFIDRMSKSFEEVAAEIEKDNAKLKEEMDTVSQAFALQERIVEGEGGESGMTRVQLVRLRRELSQNIGKITDPEIRRLAWSGTPESQQRAVQMMSDQAGQAATQNAVRSSFSRAISGDRTPESLSATAGALQGSFAGLSDAELAKKAAEARSLRTMAQVGNQQGGQTFFQKFAQIPVLGYLAKGLGAVSQQNVGVFTQQATIKAINAEIQNRADQRAAETVRATLDGPQLISRLEALRLSSRIGVSGQIAQVRAGGVGQRLQEAQQIMLEGPGLTDWEKARMSGGFGRQNITKAFTATRASTLASGKSALIQSLAEAGVKDRTLIEGRLAGATGKDDLMNIQRDLTSLFAEKAPAGTLLKAQDAIKDLIDRLTVLNATEEEAIKTNDTNNGLLQQQILNSKSLDFVQKNLRRDLRETAGAQTNQDQAIINLAKEGSPYVTGDMLEGAKMGQANRLGRGGASKGSFTTGFASVFDAASKEAKNFAEVGHQVATSLKDNFANAFGDFVTGTKRAKDAFRDFIVGVLSESARIFATKAVVSLLGAFFGSFGSAGTGSGSTAASNFPVGGNALGGPIGRASGGMIPTVLTGGELVYPPAQAARIGGRILRSLNSGTMRTFAPGGLVRGGSGVRDDVFQPLAAGSYVIRKPMVERYGADNLASLSIGGMPDIGDNLSPSMLRMAMGGMTPPSSSVATLHMADGGPVASMMSTPSPISVGASGGGGVFNIGVTINDNSTTSQSSSSAQAGGNLGDRQFGDTLARRIKQLTLQTIEEQKRMSGLLSRSSNFA